MPDKKKFARLRSQARKLFGKEFGELFAKFRKDNSEYSQDALGEEIGATRNTIGNIESGRNMPPLDTLYLLLNVIRPGPWRTTFTRFFGHDLAAIDTPKFPTQESAQQLQFQEDVFSKLKAVLREGGRGAEAVVTIIETQFALLASTGSGANHKSRDDPRPAKGERAGKDSRGAGRSEDRQRKSGT